MPRVLVAELSCAESGTPLFTAALTCSGTMSTEFRARFITIQRPRRGYLAKPINKCEPDGENDSELTIPCTGNEQSKENGCLICYSLLLSRVL